MAELIKRQHIVPKVYLKRFCASNLTKGYLYAFSKNCYKLGGENYRIQKKSIAGVPYKDYYYDNKVIDGIYKETQAVEKSLSRNVDNKLGYIIKKIEKQLKRGELPNKDGIAELLELTAIQLFRTDQGKRWMEQNLGKITILSLVEFDIETSRGILLIETSLLTEVFKEIMHGYYITFLVNKSGYSFITSDNPVYTEKDLEKIYYPLTPEIGLYIRRPIKEQKRQKVRIKRIYKASEIKKYNRLQIAGAENWILSPINRLETIKKELQILEKEKKTRKVEKD